MQRRLKVFGLIAAGTVGVALLVAAAVIAHGRAQLRNALDLKGPNAINSLQAMELGGQKQFVLIRGQDKRNPLLLFLHGGPGGSVLPDSHHFSSELEKRFVVVHWDQRGAGKSYNPGMKPQDYAVRHYVSDAIGLIERLRKRFGTEKVYLVGHSWGTILGTLVARDRPDLVAAYVGTGQVVAQVDNELISYGYAHKWASEAGDGESLKQLAAIKPPYDYADPDRALRELVTERTILWKYLDHRKLLPTARVASGGLMGRIRSPYYGLKEAFDVEEAELKAVKTMWPELLTIDLRKQAPELKVPVIFIEGRFDYQVPSTLAAQYFEQLKAPSKEFVWLEQSGHDMYFDQPEEFQKIIIDRLLGDKQAR